MSLCADRLGGGGGGGEGGIQGEIFLQHRHVCVYIQEEISLVVTGDFAVTKQ